jgi:hypothetical protein
MQFVNKARGEELADDRNGPALILRSDRCYERVDISGLTGVNAAQRAALLALGAIEQHDAADKATAGVLLDARE